MSDPPFQITSDAGEISVVTVPSRDAWLPQLERLVGTYRAIGVHTADARGTARILGSAFSRGHQSVTDLRHLDRLGASTDAEIAQPEPRSMNELLPAPRQSMPRLTLVLAASAFLLAACSGTAVIPATSTSAATASPVAPEASHVVTTAPTESPPMGVRPSLPPGAPTIADPYWLFATGADTLTNSDADGHVQTTTGMSYEVFEGGAMEGTILINGTDRAILSVNTTTGKEPIPGINPIETQYGAQIDDVLPDPSLPLASRTPDNPDIWTRSTEIRTGRTVYVRTSDAPPGAHADAFWWGDQDAGQWFALSMQTGEDGFENILTALLGQAE